MVLKTCKICATRCSWMEISAKLSNCVYLLYCLYVLCFHWLLLLLLISSIVSIVLSNTGGIVWIIVATIKTCYTIYIKSHYIKCRNKSPHLNFYYHCSLFFRGSSLSFLFLLECMVGVTCFILGHWTYVRDLYSNTYKMI